MQRAPQYGSLLFKPIYSQRAVRLKTVEMYCDICCEDLVFSKVFLNFLFCNLIKEFLNNFVYISHLYTYVKFPLYLHVHVLSQ